MPGGGSRQPCTWLTACTTSSSTCLVDWRATSTSLPRLPLAPFFSLSSPQSPSVSQTLFSRSLSVRKAHRHRTPASRTPEVNRTPSPDSTRHPNGSSKSSKLLSAVATHELLIKLPVLQARAASQHRAMGLASSPLTVLCLFFRGVHLVWMVLLGQVPVRLLDISCAGILADAKQFVVVLALRHLELLFSLTIQLHIVAPEREKGVLHQRERRGGGE